MINCFERQLSYRWRWGSGKCLYYSEKIGRVQFRLEEYFIYIKRQVRIYLFGGRDDGIEIYKGFLIECLCLGGRSRKLVFRGVIKGKIKMCQKLKEERILGSSLEELYVVVKKVKKDKKRNCVI